MTLGTTPHKHMPIYSLTFQPYYINKHGPYSLGSSTECIWHCQYTVHFQQGTWDM